MIVDCVEHVDDVETVGVHCQGRCVSLGSQPWVSLSDDAARSLVTTLRAVLHDVPASAAQLVEALRQVVRAEARWQGTRRVEDAVAARDLRLAFERLLGSVA